MQTKLVIAIALTATCAWAETINVGDTVSAAKDGTVQSGTGVHNITNSGGTWGVKAHAYDSAGQQGVDDPPGGGAKTGVYTPAGTGQAGKVTDTGTYWEASALAHISWNATQWDSTGSFAQVIKIATGAHVVGDETANSKARIHDPRSYTVTFAPGAAPEIDFLMRIGAGTQLTSLGDAVVSSSSSLLGSYQVDLLSGDLFSFGWSADSAHPNSSGFTFTSNPGLHLNDASIESQFAALITDAAGIHTMTSDFVINAAYFPTLPSGSDTLTFTMGGTTEYNADAAVAGTPEPGTYLMIGTGLVAAALCRKRKKTVRHLVSAGITPARVGMTEDRA
jgi:hypothetical protein